MKNIYEKRTDEIVELEENAEFTFIEKFFKNLFSIINTDNKIKKCYFELKNIFIKLGMPNEMYNIIERCYNKYPNDLVVKYEMLKSCVLVNKNLTQTSNFIKTEEIFTSIKQLYSDAPNETLKTIYENYMNFAE